MNVTKTRNLDLCVSCEICNTVCPVDAIDMEFNNGQFLPKIDQKTCIDCEKCVEVCPGLDITIFEDVDFEDKITGTYIEGYSAYTKNRKMLKNSTSGGAITQLVVELLKEKEYEGAFVLPFDMFDGNQARLCLAATEEEVRKASKSKYLPASDYNVVKRLDSEEKPNYIIVGTPCQLSGIKNFIELKNIDDEELLFLGLFCDKTLNFNFLDYMEEKHAEESEKLVRFDYRNKEKDGWPGHVKACFDSGREEIIDRKKRMRVKEFFQLERCLYCLDKLNRQADIAFGDCYIAGKENPSRSSVIIRTEKGKGVWEKHKDSFNWDESSVESIKKSQKISQKEENLEFAKVITNEHDFFEKEPNKSIKKSKKKLMKKKKKISFGEKKKYSKIKRSLFLGNTRKRIKGALSILKKGLGIGTFYLEDTFNKKEIKNDGNKNIVIFGGELFNKGAQAMTFTVVDQIKRRFPEKDIYLLSKDFYRDEREKENYNFEILPFNLDIGLNLLVDSNILIYGDEETYNSSNKMIDIFKNSNAFIDISGYHLYCHDGEESDIVWGLRGQYKYLIRMMLAKKFSKPYFIFPQSIGPFNYKFIHKPLLFPVMSRYLKYPMKVYPREKQGVKDLKPYTENNVEKERDIVLLNDGYGLSNIYNKNLNLKEIDIKQNSVGLVPNKRVLNRVEEEKLFNLYQNIVKTLRREGKTVYLLRHSSEDLHICEKIKSLFSEDENVVVISRDLNAIGLEKIISQFDFIVGSRYHSIIHAYKNGIPAVVLGWALKYKELLKDFDQTNYYFDMRKNFRQEKIISSVQKMLDNYKGESLKIENRLKKLNKNPVFEDLENHIGL